MPERTDTRFKMFPEGTDYNFRVAGVPLKFKHDGGGTQYAWEFETLINNSIETHKERFFPSQIAPLLRALGCQEIEGGVFEWEREDVNGKTFIGDIVHEANSKSKKDPNKKWPRLKNPRPDKAEGIPF